MLVNKYNNYIFYVHNLGCYDIVFLYNVLLNFNLQKGYDYYNINTTMRIYGIDVRVSDGGEEQIKLSVSTII